MFTDEDDLPTGGPIASPVRVNGKKVWIAGSKRGVFLEQLFDSEGAAFRAAEALDEDLLTKEMMADAWIAFKVALEGDTYFLVLNQETGEALEDLHHDEVEAQSEADRLNDTQPSAGLSF